jgi:hypothetical protein
LRSKNREGEAGKQRRQIKREEKRREEVADL